MPLKTNGLTLKQEAYCIARVSGKSALAAYRSAFGSKANDATLRKAAALLERMPRIKMRQHELVEPAKQAVAEIVTSNLLKTLAANAAIAHSDVRKLFHPDGRMKNPHEWDDATAAAVSSVKVRALFGEGKDGIGAIGTVTEVKMWDKGGGIDREMRNLGGYELDKAKPASLLEGIPRDALRGLLQALRERLAGPVVAEQPKRRRLPKPPRRG